MELSTSMEPSDMLTLACPMRFVLFAARVSSRPAEAIRKARALARALTTDVAILRVPSRSTPGDTTRARSEAVAVRILDEVESSVLVVPLESSESAGSTTSSALMISTSISARCFISPLGSGSSWTRHAGDRESDLSCGSQLHPSAYVPPSGTR